jgi:hypothetical protein
MTPNTNNHFKRFVHTIRNPVAVPTADAATEGTMSLRPDVVALSSSTAWKYSGMLKVTALAMMAPMKFPRMRPARGLFTIRVRGMMGRATKDSV